MYMCVYVYIYIYMYIKTCTYMNMKLKCWLPRASQELNLKTDTWNTVGVNETKSSFVYRIFLFKFYTVPNNSSIFHICSIYLLFFSQIHHFPIKISKDGFVSIKSFTFSIQIRHFSIMCSV